VRLFAELKKQYQEKATTTNMNKGLELSKKYKTLLSKNGVNTPLRLAHFFAQIHHESGLKPILENLNYSTDALIKTFGRHRISVEDANKYGRKPGQAANQEMLANILYGGDWGLKNLGNKKFGDGWKYRGRGFKQLTGLSNYERLTKDTGVDYVNNPDLLLTEADAMISSLWFWNTNGLNKWADEDNVIEVTRRINGGYIGLEERTILLNKYKIVFKNT
jgi:putative chitinase